MSRVEVVAIGFSGDCGFGFGLVDGRGRWAGARCCVLGVLVAVALVVCAAPARAATSHTAYVTNEASESVTPIDIATNTPGAAIPVGSLPSGVAITPDGKTAYVTNHFSNSVTPIDTATNTPGPAIMVGDAPSGVAIAPDGKTAYVANSGSNSVTPIDTATNTPGVAIMVGGTDPFAVAITPDGKTAYVANGGSNSVTPITIATNTPGPAIPVGSDPTAVAITPDGKTAYVTNQGSDSVTPIDTATNTPGLAIPVSSAPFHSGPLAVAVTPDGKTAYVADFGAGSNSVTPIDTATNTPGAAIPVGAPTAVAITPDGKTAYVTNFGSDSVTPIDTATNKPGVAIPVGGDPFAVAVTPDQGPVARFSATGSAVGQAAGFDASASSDPDGTVASYHWDFGDGSTQTTTSPTTTHTYATAGAHTVTLTVTDDAGCSTAQTFTGQTVSCNGSPAARISHQVTITTVTVHASVSPNSHFTVSDLRTHRNGIITFRVEVPGPGRIDVLETAWNDNIARAAVVLQPASRRFVFARTHRTAHQVGMLRVRVSPNARGRRLVHHHTYRVTLRLWVTYTPTGGEQRKQGFHGLHLPR